MINNDILSDIADWCIGDNYYTLSDILNNPYAPLKLEIRNNMVNIISVERLPNGDIEQRQLSMIKMIESICSKYTIPDTTIAYCGWDRSPDLNGAFFTHSRKRGHKSKNILSPCFTFYGYPERDPSIIKEYKTSWDDLIKYPKEPWIKRENKCVFVGTITQWNNRLDNTTISLNSNIELVLYNQPADSKNFISREDLTKYKFLLHLNGNGGAYASRLKYLLGSGGLVFYNYNSGDEINFWEEWWMKEDVFIDGKHYISAENKFICEEKINYYFNNPNLSEDISNNGYNFFKEFLNPDVIELFWVNLIKKYTSRII